MRLLTITAAVAALSFGASAGAAPFSLSTSSEIDRTAPKSDSSSLIERLVRSTATALGMELTAGDKQDEDLVLYFYRKSETCEGKGDAEPQPEAEPEEKKAALVGPEPIYFGF